MSDGFQLPPDAWHQAHHDDDRGRDADHVLHEVLHRAASIAARHETLELTKMRRAATLTVVVHVRWFVRNDLVDRKAAGRGFESQRAA